MTVEELCKSIIDCPHSTPIWKDSGIRVIRNFNIKKGQLDFSDGYFVDEETYLERTKRALPETDDIVISREAPMGEVCIIPKDLKCCLGQRLVLLKINKEICFPKYLLYMMQSKYVQEQIGIINKTGSIVSNLNIPDLKALKIPYRPLESQQKIASVLSVLDDKIALNRRMNAKLEQMAKRLYDHWFVQFDFPVSCHSEFVSESHSEEMLNQVQHDECTKPYKASGGKMEYNEALKREIPTGWEVKKLSEIALVKRGTTITEKDTRKGNVKVVAGGLDFSYYHNQSNRKANCITVSGSGENAGFVNFWREPIFASDCSTVQCENDIDTMLCYFALKMQEKRFYRISHKSAQPHIYPKDVAEIPIVVPNEAVKSKISDFFLKSNGKIALIEKETQKLTAIRARLLPLLMNGQVEVR